LIPIKPVTLTPYGSPGNNVEHHFAGAGKVIEYASNKACGKEVKSSIKEHLH